MYTYPHVYCTPDGRYFAAVRFRGLTRFLGTYDDKQGALHAVDCFWKATRVP